MYLIKCSIVQKHFTNFHGSKQTHFDAVIPLLMCIQKDIHYPDILLWLMSSTNIANKLVHLSRCTILVAAAFLTIAVLLIHLSFSQSSCYCCFLLFTLQLHHIQVESILIVSKQLPNHSNQCKPKTCNWNGSIFRNMSVLQSCANPN